MALAKMSSMLTQEASLSDILKEMTQQQFNKVRPFMQTRRFETNEVIFKQMQIADYLYILLKGAIEIRFKPEDGPVLVVAQITPGGVFGWSVAMGRDFYTSEAVATTHCEVCCISRQNLLKLCQQNPSTGDILLDRLADLIAERLRSTHNEVLAILRERNGL
jgi:CRP/FNR family transcriptional regulator, cyclic AMP receptor protein